MCRYEYIYVCLWHMWTQAFGGQKTALDPLELELPADDKTDVGARNQT